MDVSENSVQPGDYIAFQSPKHILITGYAGDAMNPFISADGQDLFFDGRAKGSDNLDLRYARRADSQTFDYRGAVKGADTSDSEAVASQDLQGNVYFLSYRTDAGSRPDVYRGRFRQSGSITGVSRVSTHDVKGRAPLDAQVSADGRTLWMTVAVDGDGQTDIAVAEQLGGSGGQFVQRKDSGRLLRNVNSNSIESAPCISADGRELFFTRREPLGKTGESVLYRSTRADVHSPFGVPRRVAVAGSDIGAPSLSYDGRELFFHEKIDGTFSIYRVNR